MRNLKCSLSGCSNRAYSHLTVENDAFSFEVTACHKCHDKITSPANSIECDEWNEEESEGE